MPHYADGEKAWSGDIVIGPTYNRKGEHCGIIQEITSEGETCNCKVLIFATNTKRDGHIFTQVHPGGEFDYAQVNALKKVM